MEKERTINMDLLRILACFMVVLCHVCVYVWHDVGVHDFEWKVINFYDSMLRACVPLFFMISGKFFLRKYEMKPMSEIFMQNILRLLVIYFVWSFLYAIDAVGLQAFASKDGIVSLVYATITSKYHLWYLPALIGVYCLMPFLWSIAKYQEGKYLAYVCVMFFVFGILKNTILIYPFQHKNIVDFINKFTYELSGYSGYFLLGYYLDKERISKIKTRYLVVIFFVAALVVIKVGQMDSLAKGEPSSILYDYLALPAYVQSIALFVMFSRFKPVLSGKMQSFVITISKSTLGIYLLHIFVLEHVESLFAIDGISFNPLFAIPILGVCTFVICLIIIVMLKKIRIVNKWML